SDEPFVRLLPEGQWPHTSATAGSNMAHIQFTVDGRANKILVVVALDNLVRGTAGQALQSIHLALGLDETTALPLEGVAPCASPPPSDSAPPDAPPDSNPPVPTPSHSSSTPDRPTPSPPSTHPTGARPTRSSGPRKPRPTATPA